MLYIHFLTANGITKFGENARCRGAQWFENVKSTLKFAVDTSWMNCSSTSSMQWSHGRSSLAPHIKAVLGIQEVFRTCLLTRGQKVNLLLCCIHPSNSAALVVILSIHKLWKWHLWKTDGSSTKDFVVQLLPPTMVSWVTGGSHALKPIMLCKLQFEQRSCCNLWKWLFRDLLHFLDEFLFTVWKGQTFIWVLPYKAHEQFRLCQCN